VTETSNTSETSPTRRGLATAGVVVLAAGALFGGNVFGVRDSVFGSATPAPKASAVSPFVSVGSTRAGAKTVLRSQPWWQGVARLHGTGPQTAASFNIDSGASQWRAQWRCTQGRMVVTVSGQAGPLVDAGCPGAGTAYSTRPGSTRLAIAATAAWQLRIDQQVDVPIDEPPLPSMSAPGTSIAARARFYRMAQVGVGQLTFYRLATGKYVLRLSSFYITPNVDLQIRLSPLHAPRTTKQYLSAPSVLVAPLNITAGSLNFDVPPSVDPTKYRSVVIWCPLIDSAYAGATLGL
jgi:hypothetical protein